jgi:hypothetical protein
MMCVGGFQNASMHLPIPKILAEKLLIVLSLVDFPAERVVGVFMIKITS